MKFLRWLEWIAFVASLISILGVATFVYAWLPFFTRPCHIDHAEEADNSRGDVAEDQIRDCALLGSAAEFRVSFRFAAASDFIPLVYYDPVSNIHLQWLDDDHLNVDLGEVKWLTPQIGHLGRVKISYAYSGAEPSLA
ncbi:MAG: hypothetical protein ACREDT_06240 [Methylocella sp.]